MLKTKNKNNQQSSGEVVGGEAALRAEIITIKDSIESGFLVLARDLHEVFMAKMFVGWGFPTYESYIKTELDFSYRKAKFLTDIWQKVEELGLSHDKITKMGWSKAVELIKVLTPDNADLWLEKAGGLSLAKLEAAVKDELNRTGNDTKPKVNIMTFKLDAADAGIVGDALTEAKRIHDTDNDVLALSQICGEWLIFKGKTPVRTSIEDYIVFLERSFGVRLGVVNAAEPVPKKKMVKKEEPVFDDLDDKSIDDLLSDD
jgi:hypothetical protein